MNAKQLKDLQALPLNYKVMISKQRILEWCEHWNWMVYVSFSGGKDSTVLLDLVCQVWAESISLHGNARLFVVFIDTGLEYPEIRQFVKSFIPYLTKKYGIQIELVILKPKMNFKQVLDKYGYPVVSKETSENLRKIRTMNISEKFRCKLLYGDDKGTAGKIANCWQYLLNAPFAISGQCCDVMKKRPIHVFDAETGLKTFTGEMAVDSRLRLENYLQTGCNAFDSGRPKSMPLGFWVEADIWEYLHTNNVPYSPIYDMGFTRTGCMFCMFGVHLEPEPNRFQKMQVTHPKQWEYCMFKLGLAEVLDYIGVPWNDEGQLWSTEQIMAGSY